MEIENESLKHVVGIACTLIVCCTIYGYYLIEKIINFDKKLISQTPFMRTLAVLDIGFMVHVGMMAYAASSGTWTFGQQGCVFNAWIALTFCLSSTQVMTLKAKDDYNRAFNPKKVGKGYGFDVVQVCLISFIVGSLPSFEYGSFEKATENTIGCLIDLSQPDERLLCYIVFLSVFWFVYPVVTMTKCYYQLYQRSDKYKIAMYFPLIYVMCYTPYALSAFLGAFYGYQIPAYINVLCHMMPKVLPAVKPFFYILSDHEVRKSYLEMYSVKRE